MAPVAVENHAEQLASSCDADALLVAQLMQPALHAENALPILAVSGTSGHRSQKITAFGVGRGRNRGFGGARTG